MDVFEAVSSRYSCRAFLPTPDPRKNRPRHCRARGAQPLGRQHAAVAHLCDCRQARRSAEGAARAAHGDRTAARRGHRLHDLSGTARRTVQDAALPGRRSCSISRSIFRARTSRRATGNTRATMNSSARRWRCSSRVKRRMARRNGPTSAATCKRFACWRAVTGCTPARNRPGCRFTAPCANSCSFPNT